MRAVMILSAAVLLILLGAWATLFIYFDEARLKQLASDQVRAQTGRELHLDGPLSLKFLPRLAISASQVRLSGPDNYDGPETFDAERLNLSLRLFPLLRGVVEAGAVELDGAELRVHTDSAGRSSLDGLAGEPREPAEPARTPRITSERIRLRSVSLVVSDARTGAVDRYLIDLLEFDGFAFDRPVPFQFRGNLGDPPVFEELTASGRLQVPSGAGPVEISGLEIDGRISGVTLGLAGSASIQSGPPLVVELIQGQLRLDQDRFDLGLTYRGAGRPQVLASLGGEWLDVDGLLARFPRQAGSGGNRGESGSQPLLIFRDLDLDARLDLAGMQAGGLTFRNVEARAVARNGILVIEPLAGALAGGRMDARARIDLNAEPARVTLQPSFDLARLDEALAPWGLDRFVEGAGTLALDLSARGLEPAELLRSLSGQGQYAFRDGRIHGLDLDAMVQGLRDRNVAAAARAGVGGATVFRAFEGSLSIADGRLTLPDLSVTTDRLGVDGRVSMNLADLGLDGQLRLTGDRLERIPLGLSGTLANPSLSPDVGQALQQEAGRRVLDLLDRRRSRAEPEEEPETEGNGH